MRSASTAGILRAAGGNARIIRALMDATSISKIGEQAGAHGHGAGLALQQALLGKDPVPDRPGRDGLPASASFPEAEVPAEVWEAAEKADAGVVSAVTGTVREDKRAPGGYEMTATAVEILGASPEYPITPKEHGVDFLMDLRHLWMRSSQQHAVLRVRSEMEQAIADFFYEREFVRIDSPILTGSVASRARRPSSRPTTSATRRTSRSPGSSTSSRPRRRSARSTASARRSAPRSRRRAAT